LRLKRTIYADKDGLYNQIMVERIAASGNAGLSSMPKYRRQYWLGRANGLEWAANIIRDWAGEHEPEPGEEPAVHKAVPGGIDEWHCKVCAQEIHLVAGGQGPVYVHTETGAVAGPGPADGSPRIETRMIPEQGVTLDGVWVPLALLGELEEQGPWDSQQWDAFIGLSTDQQRVLIARGLAVKETKGGCHRGPALKAFTDSLFGAPAEDAGDPNA
jgi:hypothetical protein